MASSKNGAQLPGVKHKVIGLVSGGKDSCFNLMHTVANGHEIVAVATLTPEQGIDELDSHMYQSVGTQLPPLIAEAMGLPHYSGIIKGKPVEQGPEYGSRERGGEGSGQAGDETEDLTSLLKNVLAAHPDATAVASGAILSNYQRLRIEHVCQRLGLTSLAYLWQSEQLPLVTRMIRSGLNAILVKVAGIGLTERHVGKSLAQLLPLLTRLQMQFGAHPAGEGGEYETLTLDCPLFSHRIRIDESEVIITDPEPNTVAYLRIQRAVLEEKEGWVHPSVAELRELLGLDEDEASDGLDEESLEVLEPVGDEKTVTGDGPVDKAVAESNPGSVHLGRRGRWFAVSAEGKAEDSVGAELTAAFDSLKAKLAAEGLSLLHVAHITLLLSSMADFPTANAAYIGYFGTSPPSRACVAVPLPTGQRIRVEAVGFDDIPSSSTAKVGGRSALHVQGLSYWAPANIGPYSQAVSVDARLHIAGQIALRPPSLTLPPYPSSVASSPYPHQAALALQHVRRIIGVLRNPQSTGGGWTGWVETCVAWWARPAGLGSEGPAVAQKAWRAWAEQNECAKAPIIFLRASQLPKDALLEFQVNVHTGRLSYDSPVPNDDDSDEEEEPRATYGSGEVGSAYFETCTAPASRSGARVAVFLRDTQLNAELAASLSTRFARAVTVRVYHLPSVAPSHELLQQVAAAGGNWTAVPVLNVQDRAGRSYDMALEVFS